MLPLHLCWMCTIFHIDQFTCIIYIFSSMFLSIFFRRKCWDIKSWACQGLLMLLQIPYIVGFLFLYNHTFATCMHSISCYFFKESTCILMNLHCIFFASDPSLCIEIFLIVTANIFSDSFLSFYRRCKQYYARRKWFREVGKIVF